MSLVNPAWPAVDPTEPCTPTELLPEAEQLRLLGVDTGHAQAAAAPASSIPQLTYAAALQALERQHDIVRIDRQRWPLPQGHEVEIDALHVHDDAELRLVLAGRVRYLLGDGPQPVIVDLARGDWIRIPAGLPHQLLPLPGARPDLLRLFSLPEGWRARRLHPH